MIAGLLLSLMVPAAPAAAEPPKEKKICRSEARTGSIVPQKTCRTEAEWQAMSAEQQNLRKPVNSNIWTPGTLNGH